MARSSKRRRYALRDDALNTQLEALVDEALTSRDSKVDREHVRQLLVSSLRLGRESTAGDLKLVNHALKELRHAFRVFQPYLDVPKVSVFGSARTPEDHPEWKQAHAFAERMVESRWMVITGAGDGIMGAAQGGAGREASFGVNIRLPFEQEANSVIAGDQKLVNFRYFFTRKVTFVKESHAIALFPGGFGTHDEGMEALTLVQTGKSGVVPVVFVDAPGGSYWQDWHHYVKTHLHERGLISDDDLSLFRVTDSLDVASEEILGFYRNYHSSRFVGNRLVIRIRQPLDEEQLTVLKDEFDDVLVGPPPECRGPLPEEKGEVPELPRLVLGYDRRRVGRLRQMIDRLNGFVSAPPEAAGILPPGIIERELSDEDELREFEDDENGA